MLIKYTAIELRMLVKYLDADHDSFYIWIANAIEDGIRYGTTHQDLSERYPEVARLLYHEPLKNLPLLMGGSYPKIVAWRLKRGV